MKKKFATALLTLATALAFADEQTLTQPTYGQNLPTEKKLAISEKTSLNKSYTYLRMGVTDTYPTNSVQIVPGLGLGYRLSAGDGALDLSANYTRGKGLTGEETSYFYTLPKATYLHYLAPTKGQSVYAGAGLAFGGMKNKEGTKFQGLIPSATVGYEMNRKTNFRSFVQLDVSQPAIAANLTKAEGKGFPGPIAEISVGAGF